MYTDTSSIASSAYDSGDSMESKYTVAGILSSMANTDAPLPYSGATTNLVTGSSIPLLTPTTLANLEQSFTELANNEMPVFETLQQPQHTQVNRESGFVPPLVIIPMNPVKQEVSNYQNTAEDLSDSDWTPPGAKRMKVTAAGSDNSLIKPTYTSPPTTTSTPGRKSTRRLNDSLLSSDELDKRQVRRDRNKQAAAKCRQRRLDLTNTLINETEGLEDEQATLENEIQNLQQQKEQLEFLLQAHQPVCSARKTSSKPHLVHKKESPTETVSTASSAASSASLGAGRPTSLSIPSTSHHRIVIPSSSQTATGVPISTPTSGTFMLGLDSMMDGHTGLTPITGAPTCGSQVHRNSSDSSPGEGINSPTRLLAL